MDIKSILTLSIVSKNLNKIVKNHPLYSIITKFKNDKANKYNISDWKCANNHIKILDWWNTYKTIDKFTIIGFYKAAKYGHLNIIKCLIGFGVNILENNYIALS